MRSCWSHQKTIKKKLKTSRTRNHLKTRFHRTPPDLPNKTEVDAEDNKKAESVAAEDIFAEDATDGSAAITDSEASANSETPQPPAAPISDPGTADVATDVGVPEGVEPLLRGPVHEAFAEPLQLNVVASPVVPKAPPELIEELPPEIDPNSNAIWISGYWAWDEDRDGFIWVSGVWRKQPNGRTWTAGKWVEVDGGVQWVPGFWTNSVNANKVQVLPAPPETLEQGPTVAQPTDNHFWIPGSWQYRNSRYAWRPGFWSPCHQDWVWVPEHYTWHPQGCRHVAGYWDYHWNSRGTLFAPTYFSNNIYRTAGYRYRPSVVVSLGSAFDHLWIRPGHGHYFIGDYYSNYNQRGYIPWYSYSSRTRYYDPLFAYQRWALRHSIHDLHHHYHQRHNHYHHHVNDRPYHTYRDYHHHHGRHVHASNRASRPAQAAPPSRLTGSAFVSRVDDIVRQQHRDRHGNRKGRQVVVQRGSQGTKNANGTRNNNNGANRNGRNVTSSNGVRSAVNKSTVARKVKPARTLPKGNQPNVSPNRKPGNRPQVKPNPAIVRNSNNNNGGNRTNTASAGGALIRNQTRPSVTQPKAQPNRTAVTKPRVTNPKNAIVNRNNVKRGSTPKQNSTFRNSNSTRQPNLANQPRANSVVRTSPRPSPQVNRNNIRQPQKTQTPRPNTNSRSQQVAQPRQQLNTNRSQVRPQSRSQAFRQSFTRPQTVTQPSTRNVRPNVRSTPQRSFTPQRSVTPQRRATPQRSVSPQRRATPQRSVSPQRSFQSRPTPQRSVRPTPRPSSSSNRGASINRSRASMPRPSPSRGSAFRGKK